MTQVQIDLGMTCYGGIVDAVRGILIKTWEYIASYNGETLPGRWISDRDEYVAGTTPTTGAEVAYELASPVTVSITPTQVRSLLGSNYLSCNSGDLDVVYITEGYQALVNLIQKEQGHIYSTGEQVVGTWTDGKPIYEKTVVSELALTSSWQQYLSSADMETIVSVDARYTRDNEDVPGAFSNYEVATWINRSGYILVCGQGNASSGWKIQSLTIQYTKTSNRSLNASLTRSTAQISEGTNEVEEIPTEEENEANNEVTEEPKEEMR